MRVLFKTDYLIDVRWFADRFTMLWYGALLLLLAGAPALMSHYLLGEVSLVLIWLVGGLGMMLLTGFTGQVSLGHAAFVGIGAYAHAYLLKLGVPLLVSMPLAGLLAALVGVMVGIPALRLHGMYLAIATLSMATIVEQVFVRWESVTGGFSGFAMPVPSLFGQALDGPIGFYYLCLCVALGLFAFAVNLLRAPTGRAWIALRDSEIAAQSMGVHLASAKVSAFALSAFYCGIMGALFAHKVGFLAPDAFSPTLSIQLLMLVLVGGMGSLHGAVFGAVFIVMLPTGLSFVRDWLPQSIARQPSLEVGLYGLLLAMFVLFEPLGINGRWEKIKYFFSVFPMYKRATFVRQKAYMRSERLR
ncbi:MAG: branched-chain amino acid ABC transporter permease [Burkholderiales bacterium]